MQTSMARSGVSPPGDSLIGGRRFKTQQLQQYFLPSFSAMFSTLFLSHRVVVSFWQRNVDKYWLSAKRIKSAHEKCGLVVN